jgi:hypothetical protein
VTANLAARDCSRRRVCCPGVRIASRRDPFALSTCHYRVLALSVDVHDRLRDYAAVMLTDHEIDRFDGAGPWFDADGSLSLVVADARVGDVPEPSPN